MARSIVKTTHNALAYDRPKWDAALSLAFGRLALLLVGRGGVQLALCGIDGPLVVLGKGSEQQIGKGSWRGQ